MAGNKPKEWTSVTRNRVVIRTQDSEILPINEDFPKYKVNAKMRKASARKDETVADEISPQAEETHHHHHHHHHRNHQKDDEDGIEHDEKEGELQGPTNRPALLSNADASDSSDDDDGMGRRRHSKAARHLLSWHMMMTPTRETALVGNDGSWDLPALSRDSAEFEYAENEEGVEPSEAPGSGDEQARKSRDDTYLAEDHDRPPTPELSLDNLCYLQCLHADKPSSIDAGDISCAHDSKSPAQTQRPWVSL